MGDFSLTSKERQLVFLLRWWVAIFVVATLIFIFFPDKVIGALNTLGHTIFKWRAPNVSISSEKFWLVLAVSYMVILIAATFTAQLDIKKNINYVKLILLAKLSTTLGFLLCFFLCKFSFAYLAGAAADGSIFVVTLVTYRRAIISRYIR